MVNGARLRETQKIYPSRRYFHAVFLNPNLNGIKIVLGCEVLVDERDPNAMRFHPECDPPKIVQGNEGKPTGCRRIFSIENDHD